MNNFRLTIVIPVYNTPKNALMRLANSLLKQKDTNFVALIVDDGSCDETRKLVDNISFSLKNCSVIHKNNGGVSSARNIGIISSKTEYISFVDADDILSDEYVLKLNKAICFYHPDIVYASIIKNPISDTPKQSNGKTSFFEGEQNIELIKEALLGVPNRKLKYTILGSPCARAYKTELAIKTKFREDISFYEDQLFNREYLELITSAVVIPDSIYIYEQNEYSAMHKNRNENFYLKTLPYLRTFYEFNKKEPIKYKKCLRKEQLVFLYATVNYDYIYNLKRSYKKYKKEIKEIVKEPIYQDTLKNLKLSIHEDGLFDYLSFFFIKNSFYSITYLNKLLIFYIKKFLNGVKK